MKVVLGMLFFTSSNADIQLAEKELTWRPYTIKKALPTIHQVEIINQKLFAKAALDEKIEAFVANVSFVGSRINIYRVRKVQLALLLIKKATVLVEYPDFTNIFLQKSANIFLEWTGANQHAIKVKKGKQLPYGPIYNLGPVKFEIFKTYIEINLANGFIRA